MGDRSVDLKYQSLGNAGELTVAYGAILTDYVAWGKSGGSSSEAVSKNLWSNSEDFLQTGKSLGPSLPYAKGSFFRRADLQQFSSFAWMLYSQEEIHKTDGELPNSASKRNYFQIPMGMELVRNWTSIRTGMAFAMGMRT